MYRYQPLRQIAGEVLSLLFRKGHAVCALLHTGIALVSADSDTTEGAVILCVTVMFALSHSTFDTLVCFVTHGMTSLISLQE